MAAINKFTLVQIVGSASGKPTVQAWSPSAYEQPGLSSAHKVLGVTMTDSEFEEPIAVMKRGYLRDVTEQNGETWAVGDILWAKSDGSITNVRPTAPLPLVIVGTVFQLMANICVIDVDVRVLPSIGELSGVAVETPVNLDTFIYNSTSHTWVPRQIDHGGDIAGLLDDDHTQYLKEKASNGLASEIPLHIHTGNTEAGILDHGNAMSAASLLDNDHPQYHLRHGFVRDSAGNHALTIAYNATSRIATFTPIGANYQFYVNGVQFTKSAPESTTAHANTTGKWFATYAANGALVVSNTAWSITNLSYIPAALMYYDASVPAGIVFPEYHIAERDLALHYNLHFTQGTKFISGCALSGYSIGSDTDANVTFAIASGIIADEDIKHNLTALADGGPYFVLYRTGAAGDWTWTAPSYPFAFGTTYAQWNDVDAGGTGVWGLTELVGTGLGKWGVYYVVALPSATAATQFALIPGQASYDSLADAQAASLAQLTLGTLPFEEIAPLYKVIYHALFTHGGTHKMKIDAIDTITSQSASVTLSNPSVHNALTGRDAAAAHPAAAVAFTPYSTIAATNVQSAIQELLDETSAPALDGLSDVVIANAAANHVLLYNGSMWVNATAPAGATDLDSLTDVVIANAVSNHTLVYNGTMWVNASPGVLAMGALDDLTDVDAAGPAGGSVLTWVIGNSKWEAVSQSLDNLSDVVLANAAANHVLLYNGTMWVNATPPAGDLNGLTDVVIANAAANHVLLYNGTMWVNSTPAAGASALDDLTDVVIANAAANHVLLYNGTMWVNATPPAGDLNGLTDVVIANAVANHGLFYNGSSWVNASPGALSMGALDDLTDVVIANAVTNHVLTYNGSMWINQVGGGGGGTQTMSRSFTVMSPPDGTQTYYWWKVPVGITVTRIRSLQTGTGTVTINVKKNGTNLLGSDQTPGSASWTTSAAVGTSVAADDTLDILLTSVSGNIPYLVVQVDFTEVGA